MGIASLAECCGMITAAILAGGLGSRLRPVLRDGPKVLAPVAGKPFLTILFDELGAAGIRKVVLCTGYLAKQIESTLGEQYESLRIHYSQETQPLGTAGSLRLALPLLDSDPVLVMNGDSYCSVDLTSFLEWHTQKKAVGSILLAHCSDVSRFGCVTCSPEGQILHFSEKGTAGASWINAGVYLLSQRLLLAIPEGRQVSLEYEIFPSWVGQGLFGYSRGADFLDIGTPDNYAKASAFFAGGTPKSARPGPVAQDHSPNNGRRRFVLLDRDGTLNIERGYLSDSEKFELLPGVPEGLRQLRSLGLGLVVVSNQSAIGRGHFDLTRLKGIQNRMCELLARAGIVLDAIFYCPHTPEDNCACRKPEVGLGLQAAAQLGFQPKECFMIGDKKSDIAFGRRLGTTTLLVRTGCGAEVEVAGQHGADYVVDDLREAAQVITQLLASKNEALTAAVEGRRE
jgi:D-glycero-alpha-D-manno-heptose 1-phosphate guanylyltransferase